MFTCGFTRNPVGGPSLFFRSAVICRSDKPPAATRPIRGKSNDPSLSTVTVFVSVGSSYTVMARRSCGPTMYSAVSAGLGDCHNRKSERRIVIVQDPYVRDAYKRCL